MNLAVRDAIEQPGPGAEAKGPARQPSKVLGEVFGVLGKGQPLTILELGRALPETVAFFAAYRCRIHVVDLYGELATGALEPGTGSKTLQQRFQGLFGLHSGTHLDLCLLWDMPHYLDEKQLRAFSSALFPWLHKGSLAHLFGVHSASTLLPNREYGIIDADTLSVRPREAQALPHKPHPPSFMNEWLTCFQAGRGVLLADGRVETVMKSRV